MAEKIKQEHFPNCGLDIGTGNIVSARKTGTGVETRRVRDAFLELPLDAKKMLKLANVSYVERADELLILGDAAMDTANIFGREARRPLSAGLVSSSDIDAMEILALLIKNVLGEPKVPGEHCYFSVPAAPVDRPGQDVIYHRGVLEKIVRECGYTPTAGNEAMAIIYAETAKENFSGIGLSFGAGMTNCLSGDTKVPLLDGSEKTMAELADGAAGESFWVYSSTPEGHVVPGLAHHPRQTGTQPVIRVHLDDGTYLDCTQDHRVMLRDGTFLEAGGLTPGVSLMPLYRYQTKFRTNSYRFVKDNAKGEWVSEHRVVMEHVLGRPLKPGKQDEVIHHLNYCGTDNRPENLQVMSNQEHRALHERLGKGNRDRTLGKTWEDLYGQDRALLMKGKLKASRSVPETREKILAGASRGTAKMAELRKGKTWDEYLGPERAGELRTKRASSEVREKMLAGAEKGRTTWAEEVTGKCLAEVYGNERALEIKAKQSAAKMGRTLAEIVGDEDKALEIRTRLSASRMGKAGKYERTPEIKAKIAASIRARNNSQCEAPHNHKVVRIEDLGVSVPVYDLTVDGHHNFALSCGVFVHNCALAMNTIEGLSFSVGRGGDWIDNGAAKSIGSTSSRICAIKEKGVDLNAPVGRDQEAITFYYRNLIEYAIDQIALQFMSIQGKFSLPRPVPIIVSGGTSKAGGFLDLFKAVFEKKRKKFPIEVSEVRAASDPLNAVANGLLIQAMQED